MSSGIAEQLGGPNGRDEMELEILEMDALWRKTALLNPLYSLRRKILAVDPRSPALVLSPGEFGLFAYSAGDSRIFLMVDLLRVVHPQESFWGTISNNNDEQLLFKCIWLCRYYDIETDATLVRGDCSPEKSLEFWDRFVMKIIILRGSHEGVALLAEVDEQDWMITPNDGQYDWSEFISMAYAKLFELKSAEVSEGGASAESLPNNSNNKKTRMKVTVQDVLALDKLKTMGVLEPVNIAKLTTGMNKIEKQVGNPDDFIDEADKQKARDLLEKLAIVKQSVKRMLGIWKGNDFFQGTKTAFMVAYAKSLVETFQRILETQRTVMLDIVNLLNRRRAEKGKGKGRKGKKDDDEDEPAVKFIDGPGTHIPSRFFMM